MNDPITFASMILLTLTFLWYSYLLYQERSKLENKSYDAIKGIKQQQAGTILSGIIFAFVIHEGMVLCYIVSVVFMYAFHGPHIYKQEM